MEKMIESFEKKDRLYVETRAFRELVDVIQDRHMPVITGLPGDGKTTMAYHLSLKYHKKDTNMLNFILLRAGKITWMEQAVKTKVESSL